MSGTPVHTLHRGEWSLAEARRQLLSIAKELHARGWLANHDGNVTMRMPAGKLLATPTAVSKRVLTEGDLIVVDGDDRVVQGGRKPFSELKMHRAVYAARPDVQVVIHTHAPSATALAIAGKAVEPRMIAEAVVSLGDAIPLIGYGFPNGAEQVAALKAAADRCDAATIENHGVFAWATTSKWRSCAWSWSSTWRPSSCGRCRRARCGRCRRQISSGCWSPA